MSSKASAKLAGRGKVAPHAARVPLYVRLDLDFVRISDLTPRPRLI
jgi:hypothetical protein